MSTWGNCFDYDIGLVKRIRKHVLSCTSSLSSRSLSRETNRTVDLNRLIYRLAYLKQSLVTDLGGGREENKEENEASQQRWRRKISREEKDVSSVDDPDAPNLRKRARRARTHSIDLSKSLGRMTSNRKTSSDYVGFTFDKMIGSAIASSERGSHLGIFPSCAGIPPVLYRVLREATLLVPRGKDGTYSLIIHATS